MESFVYSHVDVFASKRLHGNGLTVVFDAQTLNDSTMLELTREFKQFETIFLSGYDGKSVRARIFTAEGELPFAGHPVLGACAALHERHANQQKALSLCFHLAAKDVPVVSTGTPEGYRVQMQQGKAQFLAGVPVEDIPWLCAAHHLSPEQLDATLPIEVVSTGLPYVLIPVTGGLEQARITVQDLQSRIAAYGAAYTYLFNTRTLEARTWDNLGLTEDSATGSAAGPVCAYLIRHGRLKEGETLTLRQGHYANRPGVLHAVQLAGDVYVSGDVMLFAKGEFTPA